MAAVQQYSAGRNFISATKMNYFHHFLKQLTGWTLRPRVDLSGTELCRVADMGTQTGIWAIEIAEDPKLNANVTAFDISDKFFPPATWLPRNLTLRLQDILHPFPDDLLGMFDVVHFRLSLALTAENLGLMIERAISLLKPGGYIQWVEHDKTDLRSITASPGQDTSAVEALIELEKNPFPGYNHTWVNSIAPTLRTKGLQILADERVHTRPSLLMQVNELHLLALVDLPPGLSKAADEFKEKYFDRLAEDSTKGVSSVDSFVVVVARKPSEYN